MDLLRVIGLLSALCAVVSCGSSGAKPTPAALSDYSFLYVQEAKSGTASALGGPTPFTITLTEVSETLVFADRPSRQTSVQKTESFVAAWSTYGFDKDPPNAVLEVTTDKGQRISTAVELQSPSYDSSTRSLTYVAKELNAYPGFYENPQHDADLPLAFRSASLFIDDATPTVLRRSLWINVDQGGRRGITYVDIEPGVTFCSAVPQSEILYDPMATMSADFAGEMLTVEVSPSRVTITPADVHDPFPVFGSGIAFAFLVQVCTTDPNAAFLLTREVPPNPRINYRDYGPMQLSANFGQQYQHLPMAENDPFAWSQP